jgi:hypothetical protein
MFDSNAMADRASLARSRDGGTGKGRQTVYASSKAFHESRGIKEMSVWRRAVYEASTLWKSDSQSACAGFRWDCLALTLDRDADGQIPF